MPFHFLSLAPLWTFSNKLNCSVFIVQFKCGYANAPFKSANKQPCSMKIRPRERSGDMHFSVFRRESRWEKESVNWRRLCNELERQPKYRHLRPFNFKLKRVYVHVFAMAAEDLSVGKVFAKDSHFHITLWHSASSSKHMWNESVLLGHGLSLEFHRVAFIFAQSKANLHVKTSRHFTCYATLSWDFIVVWLCCKPADCLFMILIPDFLGDFCLETTQSTR